MTCETGHLHLPVSFGRDPRFVPWQEAQRHYG